VFTAYFDPDGTFNQPFFIRGKLSRAELEPFSLVELEGETYPAPAVPEKWLELNYGAGWRIPDPGHQFDIDEQTRRRFDSWFGSFNLHRDYWEARHGDDVTVRHDPSVEFEYIADSLSSVRQVGEVIDIGCGISSTVFGLRQLDHRVAAADFSLPALQAQSIVLESDAHYFLNLNDRHSVLEFALSRVQTGRATNLVFEHVLEGLGGDGKQNAFLLMRWLLREKAVAAATIDTDLPGDHSFDDPTSWHFPLEDFVKSANSHGLVVRAVRKGTRRDDLGRTRQTAHVRVAFGEGELQL
jgi:hypothetical protein